MSFLWERYVDQTSRIADDGGILPSLRKGMRGGPGEVPALWPYYTTLRPHGQLTRHLEAEHVCLTIFGFHQQGKAYPAHTEQVALGRALKQVRDSGQFSPDAVDRRFNALATAWQLDEISHHLRALVGQMRSVKSPIGFNYTELFWDLVNLQDDATAGRVRRRWGSDYFSHFLEKSDSQQAQPATSKTQGATA